jgi:hypothetical protein
MIQMDSFGGIVGGAEIFGAGKIVQGSVDNMSVPSLRLVRYDDAWRPLASGMNGSDPGLASRKPGVWEFEDLYGGRKGRAYGAPSGTAWPEFWPPSVEAWPYHGDIWPHTSMDFSGRVTTTPVEALGVSGVSFCIRITDRRDPKRVWPQKMIRMPVGIEVPVSKASRVFGLEEAYHNAEVLDSSLSDPSLPRGWYYLEPSLFGLRQDRPEPDNTLTPSRHEDCVRAGAPFAAFTENGKVWTCVAGEADYGAAILWGEKRLRFFSTVYLPPGGEAEWSFVVWKQECTDPSELILQSTRPGGFFDVLNPRGFVPKGAPEGPIVFANISRLPFQFDELKALRPKLVLLNYHYDHISSTANLYGNWKTYEGFDYSEEKLRKLIADLRGLGVPAVGCYGTQIEQPETHAVVKDDDFVIDPWGRRYHAWEPGNWVVDGGHRDCAERLARAEAEFCKHYGMDAVFVDRIDHCGVNANPARVGKPGDARLERIPSIRLGILELNKQRMAWMKKLNPNLRIGLNNTSGWVGVRYSDWNQLEGGNTATSREVYWLMQPSGVVDKRHTTPLFGPSESLDLFQVIGESSSPQNFAATMRTFIAESLFGGVEASPYGDEWFVDKNSMFFNGRNDKAAPDDEKFGKIAAIRWQGGREWREAWEAVQPALEASRQLATPPVRATNTPDQGSLPESCHLHARTGENGGAFIAVRNQGRKEQKISFRFERVKCQGTIQPAGVRVWWVESPKAKDVHTLEFVP